MDKIFRALQFSLVVARGFIAQSPPVRRKWLRFIDIDLYLAANPDVRNSVGDNRFYGPRVHLLTHGLCEAESGARVLVADEPVFNKRQYLANNPDVAQAISQGEFISAFEHFISHGRHEIKAGLRLGSTSLVSHPSVERYDLQEFPLQMGARLIAPQVDEVKCSIVVPFFNNARYTFSCIASILRNTAREDYEIIIIDDASDETDVTLLRDSVENVTWVTNEENLGYLKSCNKAADRARGDYLFLLNNDVLVQPDWLTELLTVLEGRPDVGCVGAKLVSPDGRLMEAGGITFSDGKCWNFGRGADPFDHDYCYSKAVDYVSGCTLGISTALWRSVGGYAEELAPAYYEDVDLAFKIRAVDLQVWCVPSAIVVHYEGVSYGNDEENGAKKRLMDSNRAKIIERWHQDLGHQSVASPTVTQQELFLARDRSQSKRKILYVDHHLPAPDKDAGSGATLGILKSLLRLNAQVYFLPANYADYPGGDALRAMGIEVLAGNGFNNDDWVDWIKNYGGCIDTVFLSRPHIAPLFIADLREHTSARLVYVAHDLAFLRTMRQATILEDEALSQQAQHDELREIELLQQFDSRIFFSSHEVSLIESKLALPSTIYVPVFSYPSSIRHGFCARDREGLMFVGGFNHPPNLDGVMWFLNEVWPVFASEFDTPPPLYIVGSQMPDVLLDLADSELGLKLLPDASREALEEIYAKAKVAIAPLRFGAGVKGKVVEAMRYGVPVVTTTIGAEGIDNVNSAALVADDAILFASSLLDLYRSDELSDRMSDAGERLIKDQFSDAIMDQKLGDILA